MIDNREDWENRPRNYGLTAEDRQRLVERHLETCALRQAESDLNLLKALKLGKLFQRFNDR